MIPKVEVKQMNDGILYETVDNMILQPNEAYYVSFDGMEEYVGLVVTEIKLKLPYFIDKDAGQFDFQNQLG